MTSLRKVLGFLTALALGAFALPAAATYYYSLNMCAYGTGCTSPIAMTAVNNVSTGTVTAIFKNESPANLTMKSFTLSVPTGSGLTITNATLPAGQTATTSISGGTLTVKSMSIGIVKGATYTVNVTVTTASCANVTGNWTAQPWTGTSLNGSKFVIYPVSATHPATTFTPACSFAITTTVLPSNVAGSLSCAPNPVPYNANSLCTASATNAGYDFDMFSGACSGSTPTCTLSGVKNATAVTAAFKPKSFPVNASVPNGHGTIVPPPQNVTYNTPAQLTVTPDPGYTVTAGTPTDNCGAGGSLSGSTYTTGPVPVGGCTVTGSFTPINYTVTTAVAGTGTGTITPLVPSTSSVPFGTAPSFTVTAAANSSIDKVTDTCGNGGALSGSGATQTYTAAPVKLGGCIVTASFVANTISLLPIIPTSAPVGPKTFDVNVGFNPAAPTGTSFSVDGCGATATTSSFVGTSVTFTITIPSVPPGGACTINLNATNYAPVQLVNIPVYGGQLACGDPLDPNLTNPGGTGTIGTPGYAEGKRGQNNKDGNGCVKVNYTFTNNILQPITSGGDTVVLKWDLGSQPLAAFSYTMTWQDEAVDPLTGMPTRRTKVAPRLDANGNPILPYNWGVACISSSLPAQYSTLSAGVGSNALTDTSIALSSVPVTTPPTPFAIVIDTERMLVTGTSGSTWTVVRGNGQTTVATHLALAPVMSTPLPIDPNPYLVDGTTANTFFNKPLPICIWDEGWSATGVGMVRYTTAVFDIGDGGVSRSP